MHYYLIAPLTIARKQDAAFTYHSDQALTAGNLVRVSVGKQEVNGVVLRAVARKPAFATKPVGKLLCERPLPWPLVQLAEWMSQYYITHLSTVLQTMLPTGLHKARRAQPAVHPHVSRAKLEAHLTAEQRAAVTAINTGASGTMLLHGVTGSGKTMVYIAAALARQARGQSSIVLVPEISLTPQLVAEFIHHFKHVVVTHSNMTEAQRHQAWLEVLQADEPLVVIGPRSALFMPVGRVGLIVIDEAHESSYKQEQSPRYSALRAASVLTKLYSTGVPARLGTAGREPEPTAVPILAGAVLVLGSATPNVTDYYLAEHTGRPILRLTRTARPTTPPVISLIDNTRKDLFREHRYLSDALLTAIRQALSEHQQVLLFHNRRGTAPTTLCDACGWSALCPHCFVPFTLHADQHKLLCHLCGRQAQIPQVCPECHNPNVVFRGIGTKSIEQEMHKLFHNATIARFDADNAAHETLHQRYQELYDSQIDIIIGTQILAKGLDLPNLAVVGVLQADSGLGLPDYQSEERVHQLLSQVTGRVGRNGHASTIVIQTYQPEHPAIALSLRGSYQDFYQHTLQSRRQAHFPPFCYLLKLTAVYKTEKGAVQAATRLATELRTAHASEPIEILGPTPAFRERLGDTYRWQLLLKSPRREHLVNIARALPQGWQADIDPAHLL